MASFLGGAMRALARHPKTAAFFDTHRYSSLPANWADDPEIVRLAADAWREASIESPFFRAFYEGSRLVDAQGRPVVMYHGSRLSGLDSIDPDMHRMGNKGRGSSFAASHPAVALSYTSRPGPGLAYFDAAHGRFRDALSSAFEQGEPILLPDLGSGRLRMLQFAPGEARLPVYDEWDDDATNLSRAMKSVTDTLNEIDWQANMARLSRSYGSSMPGYPVPKGALESAVSQHLAYDTFADVNSEALKYRGPAFSNPVMGEIYPLYVNARAPLVVDSMGDEWTRLAGARVDPASLLPGERGAVLRRAAENGSSGVTAGDYFPYLLERSFGSPTDTLAGHLHAMTDHDALLMRSVHDGGGEGVPAADVVAYFDARQAKDAFRNRGTFNPGDPSMLRAGTPVAAGGALAAAMGARDAEARLRERDLPVEEAWNPLEALALAPIGAASLAGAAGGLLADAVMGLAPDIPEVPDEYYEAAQ